MRENSINMIQCKVLKNLVNLQQNPREDPDVVDDINYLIEKLQILVSNNFISIKVHLKITHIYTNTYLYKYFIKINFHIYIQIYILFTYIYIHIYL